jgi:glucose-1-phosphate adenylyltransferase
MLRRHLESGADVTVSVIPVGRGECRELGILSPDAEGRIRAFREKPATDAELDSLALPESLRGAWGLAAGQFVASMGVYLFRLETLREALEDRTKLDFGKHILPALIASHRVFAHPFRGYWRDIGTIGSFYEANLALTEENPAFRFALPEAPVYTRTRFLPSSKFLDAKVTRSTVADGCIVFGAELERCVVGVRTRIQKGARLKDTIVMGIDFHEEDDVRAANRARGVPDAGIGPDCVIERAIIDKNARIGAGCRLAGAPGRPDADGDGWYVRDGIVIIPKNAVVPPGTVV